MIKVIVVSGFLGAGKTTLIKKILNNQEKLGKVMLLENEFGEIGIDGQLLKNAIEVKEINNGCICCSLEGKLEEALDDIAKYEIETLIVEPSGVAKLSEIITAFIEHKDFEYLTAITVVDVTKAKRYHKNFREFYDNQIGYADALILSRTDISEYKEIKETMHLAEDLNEDAIIVTTPLNELTDDFIFDLLLNDEKDTQKCVGKYCDDECECNLNNHHCDCHHEYDHECSCNDECHCHEEHECVCGLEENECHCEVAGDESCQCTKEGKECHCHDEETSCDCHHEHDHECSCHNHDANDTFMSIGFKTARVYSEDELNEIMEKLGDDVIRAKGIVKGHNSWLHFEFTPGEKYITTGEANYTGLISIIGTNLDENSLKELFDLND